MKTNLQVFAAIKEEASWLTDLRMKWAETWQTLAPPVFEKVAFHRWNLTDEMIQANYGEELINSQQYQYESTENAKIVQYGTETMMEQLPQEMLDQGVIFTDLFTAMTDYPELVEEHFMTQAVKVDENQLTAYHAAYLNSGVFIYIPKNIEVQLPLEALFVQNGFRKEAFNKHVLLVADENSSVTYVEKMMTEGTVENSATIIVEVIAKAGARVKYSAVDHLGEQTTAYLNRHGHVAKDASIDWAIGMMSNGNMICDFDSDLIGDGSSSTIKAIGISTGRQIQGINTRVTNTGKHSVGHILQHGVILDRSTLTFNGVGHIKKGAKGADAQQESRVLMLSESARGDANPILLIDENEVTAGHAASAGRVDEEEMFYLLSRGIPEAEAQRLVIRGFLGTVIKAIPLKDMRDELIEMIDQKLIRTDCK